MISEVFPNQSHATFIQICIIFQRGPSHFSPTSPWKQVIWEALENNGKNRAFDSALQFQHQYSNYNRNISKYLGLFPPIPKYREVETEGSNKVLVGTGGHVTNLPVTPVAVSQSHPHCQKAPGWPFRTSQEQKSLPMMRRPDIIHQDWQEEVTLKALNTVFPAPARVKEPERVSGASALVQTQPLLL